MFKRAAIATSVNAWGWQPHHTVITLCIFSHSISLSICVCVCTYRLRIGHLAGALLPLWVLSCAPSPHPESWQGEQSVPAQRKPAFACDKPLSFIIPRRREPMQTWTVSGRTKNTPHQMPPTALGSWTYCAMFTLPRKRQKKKKKSAWVSADDRQILGGAAVAVGVPCGRGICLNKTHVFKTEMIFAST